ncbi:hypothetical protein GGX14DRAFT_463953 [Mycena pura]|uniref:Uncharacterized protein n=1 Tax=Mycena pura TaxID=153505 RepID=A0AAD6VB83_9AGAR|nr:hypothetical protein GGX14DRAFT_463953 [Mycena pura]
MPIFLNEKLPTHSDAYGSVSHPSIRHEGARRRKPKGQIFFLVSLCSVSIGLALWRHFPTVRQPIGGSSSSVSVKSADDPRLEWYQNPDDAKYCLEWEADAEKNLAFASLELPVTASLLFFLSRGPVAGHIEIYRRPGRNQPEALVNVTMQYHASEDLSRTKVCRMGSGEEHGVLFWAEYSRALTQPAQDIRFQITVQLPARGGWKEYKDLSTDLPLFSHALDDFTDIWGGAIFEVVRFKSSNAPIHHGGLAAHSAFIQTSNAQVQGLFLGMDAYSVQTSNASIASEALLAADEDSPNSGPRIDLRTSNGKINALLLLADNTVLSAEIHTTLAPLEITVYQHNVYHAAQMTVLRLSASTSAARAALHLDSGYEGTYELHTRSPGEASVEEKPDVEDPLGLGRLRMVTREPTERGAHLRGSVFWSEAGEPGGMADRGFITVSTSVEHVELFLDESLEGSGGLE